jgi:hypothetical protein
MDNRPFVGKYRKMLEEAEMVRDMESGFKNSSQLRRLQQIEVNKPCLSIYSGDLKLYRALIEENDVDRQIARVRYVDYGNGEIVQYEK